MNELQIFESEQFGQVRTITEDGNVLFCGADVARALGYARPQNAISAHCKGALKRGIGVQTGTYADGTPNEQQIEMLFIPESDMYRLIVGSKLPDAVRFEKWVFSEILPSVNRHGAYMTPETLKQVMLTPDFIIGLAMRLKAEEERVAILNRRIEADKPKVTFADSVMAAKNSIPVGDLAKILKQNGVETGAVRLFKQLREEGYLCRSGESYNVPTQKAMEAGLFTVKESVYTSGYTTKVCRTPMVTGKGQIHFINKFKRAFANV